ncbi:MAG: hypothetical protein WAM97_12810 [Acidimicrobiales bacterium]
MEILMHPLRVLLVTLFAAAITTSATTLIGVATPAGAATGSIWQVETTVNPHTAATFSSTTFFSSVSASGTDDAWAVGTTTNSHAVNQPLAEHWNGTTWSVVTLPLPVGQTSATLSGVDDLSPTDAWAVGSFNSSQSLTLIEHWNGTSWSVVPSPNPVTGTPGDGDELTAIAGTGPNDLWAAGSDTLADSGGGEIQLLFEHFNGTSWTGATSPADDGGGVASAITAISPDDFWAVGSFSGGGSNDLAAQWNGIKWSIATVPNITTSSTGGLNHLTGISADGPDDVWASGYAADTSNSNFNVPGLLHWNGATWTAAKVPNLGGEGSLLLAVQVLSPNDAWSVGQTQSLNGKITTLTQQFNGKKWSIVTSPDPGKTGGIGDRIVDNSLESIGSAGGGNLFAVGQRGAPQRQCCVRTLAIGTTLG